MKKTVTYILAPLIIMLSGCGGSDEEVQNGNNNYKPYSTSEIGISIPMDWDVVEKNNFTSNVPDNTIVAFISNEKNEKFTSNLNITKTITENNISLSDFSKSSILNAKKKLLDFVQTSHNEQEVNGQNIISYTFSGKQRAQQPLLDFKQSFIKIGDAFYTVTYAHLPSETEANIDEINIAMESIIAI